MYPNLMELKVYYEMKKEEMEKAVMANKYLKKDQREKAFSYFLNRFKKNPEQNKAVIPTTNGCKLNSKNVCCEN